MSGTVRRVAGLLLVAFALLAAAPEALAQAQPGPEPRELWQQFPLDPASPRPPQAPAERESTQPASAPTVGGTAEEGDGSMRKVQIAAIVLAMALVLMLTTGALAYAGPFDLGFGRRRGRVRRSFSEVVHAREHAESGGREDGEPRAKPTVAVPSRARRQAERAAAAKSLDDLVSEVDRLKAKLDVGAGAAKMESPAPDLVESLKERLDMDEIESLKAKRDVGPPPGKSQGIRDDELETLKEKLDVQSAHGEGFPEDELQILKEKLDTAPGFPKRVSTTPDEVETLKAKLAGQAPFGNPERASADDVALKAKLADATAAPKREPAVTAAFEATLVDYGPPVKPERKVAFDVGKPSPKLDVSHAPAQDLPRGPAAAAAGATTLDQPSGVRAADPTPLALRRMPAATRRSTVAELLHEHGSALVVFAIVVIALALVLVNISLLLDISVVP